MARILFVDGTEGYNPHTIVDKPTGGILNSLTVIPQYLASVGHEVYVISEYKTEEDVNGVHYVSREKSIPKWDFVVFNRNVLPLDFVTYSKSIGAKVIWWLHDVTQTTYLPDAAFKMVDKVVALSQYCKRTYSDFYKIPESKFVIIPNGVNVSLFNPGDYSKRNPNMWIMASALIKGFLPIDDVYENLKRVNPNLDFRIYSNQSLHGKENNEMQAKFLAHMTQKGAHVYAPVSPTVLADILKRAYCLLMPNTYPEICSNLLLQARACGCPVVTSNIGANDEFIESGISGLKTTKWQPHDMHIWNIEFAQLALNLNRNKELHKTISEKAQSGVKSWKEIGEIWNNELFN